MSTTLDSGTETERTVHWGRALIALVVGAIAFAIGFYGGFFLNLALWGLEVREVAFVGITVLVGGLAAGSAISATAQTSAARRTAILTAVLLAAATVGIVLAIDGDLEAIALGGLAIVAVTTAATHLRPT